MNTPNDTIAAIATAPGRGGIGVVRLSGSLLLPLAQTLSGGKTPQPRRALFTDFVDRDGAPLDNGLMLYFPAPASFTGEDVLELQGHGGPVVLRMLLERCLELGARPAEPGEFSKRAFLNDKMDLAQAESVADLIDAGSRAAAKMALRSLKGRFSERIHALTDELIQLRMLVEATLDFPEEDIDFLEAADACGRLTRLQAALDEVLRQAAQGAVVRDGITVVLVGAPNVGKSSLLNALAGEEVAIVTDIAGTTRDTVREQITLDGIAVHIVDTAGLRDTQDIVETIGIARSREAVQAADVALILIDPREGINPTTAALVDALPADLARLVVLNKADLWQTQTPPFRLPENLQGAAVCEISAKTGQGLDDLRRHLLAQTSVQGNDDSLFLARERHLLALKAAQAQLTAASGCLETVDLLAEHLRLAQESLNEITGEFGADDLLGVIFSRFCIGK